MMLSKALLKNVFSPSSTRFLYVKNTSTQYQSIFSLNNRSYSTSTNPKDKQSEENKGSENKSYKKLFETKEEKEAKEAKEGKEGKEGKEDKEESDEVHENKEDAQQKKEEAFEKKQQRPFGTALLLFTLVSTVTGYFLYNYKKDATDEEISQLGSLEQNFVNHIATPFRERFDNTFHNLMREHAVFDAVFGPAPLQKLLGPPLPEGVGRQYTLVIDLDTIAKVTLSNKHPAIYKRAALDYFLSNLSKYYEVVLYSNNMPTGNPELITFKIDPQGNYLSSQLFMDSGLKERGRFSPRVEMLNRDPKKVIFLDTHQYEHPNVINIGKFNPNSRESVLINLLPVLKNIAASKVDDVTLELNDIIKDPRGVSDASLSYTNSRSLNTPFKK